MKKSLAIVILVGLFLGSCTDPMDEIQPNVKPTPNVTTDGGDPGDPDGDPPPGTGK